MSAQVQLRADLRELVEELQRLPDDQRAALVLFELGDQSHAQIAAVLGVRREKVKALVFQAREGLMRARDARATPCVEIREQLATDAGRVPRRSVARRHIDRCPGCAEFEREVRRQRAAFAAILPLVPTSASRPRSWASPSAAAGAPSRSAARAPAAARPSPRVVCSRPAESAAVGSRAAPERPPRAPSAPRARPAWPRAWPRAAAEWGWRACRPRAWWRRSCPSWPWAAVAPRCRSTATGRRVRPRSTSPRCVPARRRPPIRRPPSGACPRPRLRQSRRRPPTRPQRRPRPRRRRPRRRRRHRRRSRTRP